MLQPTSQTPRRRYQPHCGLAGAAALLITCLAADAEAAPKFMRLSFTGPTNTSMTVSWNTDANAGTEVLYGVAPGNLTQSAGGVSAAAAGALGYIHTVELTGLQAATTYYYVAGDSSDGYSPELTFTTGPTPHELCGTFRFVFLGDNRPDPIFGGGENYAQILVEAMAHSPDLILSGADLVIDGDQIDQWVNFLGWSGSAMPTTPYMPCIGNHDTGPGNGDSANYNQIFALPRATGTYGSSTEDYYYFTYGNAIFVALSTENFSGGSIPFGNQAAWLDEVLTDNPRKWKIVYYHKPTYTKKDFTGIVHEPNEEGQNAAFVPVFDAHHVDVVLSSHNHWYERYEPSACANQGDPGSDDPCLVGGDPANGTVYFVSGGAGAFTIPALLCGFQVGQVMCSADHHFMVFDIQDESLTLQTWAAYPQAASVIDSLVITKAADSVCDGGTGGTGGAGGSSTSSSGTSSTSGSGGAGPGGTGTGATGTGGTGTGATTSSGLSSGTSSGGSEEDSGCGCRAAGRGSLGALGALAVLLCGGFGLHRRRRR